MGAIGRNSPCHCGSGKKYKKCCLNRDSGYFLSRGCEEMANCKVHECLIRSDFEGDGLAVVHVVRQQPNSKYSMGLYMVDTLCLGLKDVFCLYNRSYDEILRARQQSLVGYHLAETAYEYARTIILGGIDYARRLGFDPHPDWKEARFMVEDGRPYTDDFKFGKEDGKPFYVVGPHDDFDKVVATLERSGHDVGGVCIPEEAFRGMIAQ